MQVVVRHLFISPGHNFFGRHGLSAGQHPTIEAESLYCRAGRGVEGDRFFDYKPDYRGQITFFDFDVYEEIKRALGVPELNPGVFRRNVLIEGLALGDLVGSRFSIGESVFEGCAESAPCHWMNDVVAPGAEAWLKGRGGLRAKIWRDGRLTRGTAEFVLQAGQMAWV